MKTYKSLMATLMFTIFMMSIVCSNATNKIDLEKQTTTSVDKTKIKRPGQ